MGLKEWRRFIKKNGYLTVHEMTWPKVNPPKEIFDYWNRVYPKITTIEKNLEIIKKSNNKLIDYFPLPEDAWRDFYYKPLEKRLIKLRLKYKNNPKAIEMINQE
jgi:ubiquinone/menaquinone biosynthesis C-methylase UbiE